MKTVAIALFCVGAVVGCATVGDQGLTMQPWVMRTAEWTEAPLESGMVAWAPAKIARFKPDHSFSMIYCIINRGGGNDIAISAGEGLTVFSGAWATNRYGMRRVTFKKVDETFPQVPAAAGAVSQSRRVDIRASGILIDSEPGLFVREPHLSARYYDRVVDPIVEFHERR